MKLYKWLGRERGRSTALATHLGIGKSMVSQMAGGGKKVVRVPPAYYRAIVKFTRGKVRLEDLIPE